MQMRLGWRPGAAFGIVLAGCLLATGGVAGAQGAGSLDTTFGTNGVATSALGAQANAMVVVPNGVSDAGDIVLAATPGANSGFQVARFTAGGALDSSFGGGSGVLEPFTSGSADGVAVIPSGLTNAGDVVAVGHTTGYTGCSGGTALVAVEYTPAGTLNTSSFNNAGVGGTTPGTALVACSTDAEADLASVAIDGSGNIVVAGFEAPSAVIQPLVARLTPAGALDTTFGGSGVITAAQGTGNAQFAAVSVVPSGPTDAGDVVVSGYDLNGSSQPQGLVIAYKPNGTPDSGFGCPATAAGSCVVGVPAGTTALQFNAEVVLPTGAVVLAGFAVRSDTSANELAVVQLTSGGALDGSFGSSGMVLANPSPGNATGQGISFESTSNVLLVGGYAATGANTTGLAAELNVGNGTLVTSFGTNGIALQQAAPAQSTTVYAEATLANSNILLAGAFSTTGAATHIGVMRLLGVAISIATTSSTVTANSTGGANISVTVQLNSASTVQTQVQVCSSAPGSSVNGTGSSCAVVTIPPNTTSVTTNVAITNACSPGGHLPVSITISNPSTGATITGSTTQATTVVCPLPAGYWLVASDGGIFNYGQAGFFGSAGGTPLNKPIVGMAPTPDAGGYWLVASDGGIFNYGDAAFFGSTGGIHLNKPIVAMAPTSDGKGYWLVASDGGIFSYGDAQFYGSTGAITLNKPIVAMAPTPDGGGYWLVASDGGIFSYGDAQFYGSTGAIVLNKPVVGMAATGDGHGYWLVASDGGIFNYGDAPFDGSTGGITLNKPIVGMALNHATGGYWLVASDGGIFNYGGAPFFGSTGGITLNKPIVGMAEG